MRTSRALGLSFQRSQNSGRYDPAGAAPPAYYKRAASSRGVGRPARRASSTGSTRRSRASSGRCGSPSLPAWRRCWQQSKRPWGGAGALHGARSVRRPCRRWRAGLTAARAAAAQAGEPTCDSSSRARCSSFRTPSRPRSGCRCRRLPARPTRPTRPHRLRRRSPGQSFEIRARVTNRSALPITPARSRCVTDPGWRVHEARRAACAAWGQRLRDRALRGDARRRTCRSARSRISPAVQSRRPATRRPSRPSSVARPRTRPATVRGPLHRRGSAGRDEPGGAAA